VLGPVNSRLWSVPSQRYMELGSHFLFLQEQTKDIIIICERQQQVAATRH
jgi:hypothetical protein